MIGSNFPEVKGPGEQNKTMWCLRNDFTNINMLKLTIEETTHSNPNIFLKKD